MNQALIEKIKKLTLDIDKLVQEGDIFSCEGLLIERQQLLEQLFAEFSAIPEPKVEQTKTIEALFTWIKNTDDLALQKVVEEKQLIGEKVLSKNKANKAIKLYRSIE
ncbi:hypothetical protein tinsulaeT_09860 [Thalassotalea insulae]|uniref:Flagellar protein FliT n=1 Tax=Thalassotalea insulae TaxID=2056778 RepID=A0ABQ6GU08_9GAMM|nr:hypothetical protein [Thalassotalea insulae]GLX77646.1 hypothetical protein tinsulaeT_09860 [Thalassotalea insulae]